MVNKHTNIATKVQAFVLVTWCEKTQKEASAITGLLVKTIQHYCKKVVANGFDKILT